MHTYEIVKRINIIYTCSLFSEETQYSLRVFIAGNSQ